MISNEQIDAIVGRPVVGTDGKIGKVGQVFLDDETGLPEFATVTTGLFGKQESFVPLAQAEVSADGLRVPYATDKVKAAPRVENDADLSQQEEAQLYSYYGLSYSEQTSGSGLPTSAPAAQTSNTAPTSNAAPAAPAAPAMAGAGTRTDNAPVAVTRAEERLAVGTQRVESGRVRLRKHITTEQVAAQVAVSSERVQVTREPITDPSSVDARIEEAEAEVVLTAERPVVDKEVVPVERVRLGKEQVSEQVTVGDQVSSEQVEMVEERGGTVTRTDVDSDPRH